MQLPANKAAAFPPLNINSPQFPSVQDRLKYWQTFLSSDSSKQNQIKSDEAQWTLYVWAGVPDELRPKLWNSIISTHKHSSTLPSSTPVPKARFLQQLDPVINTYALFSPNDKHLSVSQSQNVDIALKYAAHHLELDNYIDGTYDILAAASQHVQFTQLYQLFCILHTTLKPLWGGTLLQPRAIQTFAITFLNTLQRDCVPLLYKLSYMGLDVSDLQLFITTWMLTLGSQHFPFSYPHRIIDILLLDNIGIATLSGVFMGTLLHFHQLSGGNDQLGFPNISPPSQTQSLNININTLPPTSPLPSTLLTQPISLDIQTLHQFPNHPQLNLDSIFHFGFQFFRQRYPSIELSAININWKNFLTQPLHSGFRIFNNPTVASAHKEIRTQFPALDLKSPYGDSSKNDFSNKMDLVKDIPLEKLKTTKQDNRQALRVANPICQRLFFPSIYSNQFGSSQPVIGGYNTLSIRLSDIAKVLHVVNQRFYRKRAKIAQRQKKLSPNYLSMVMNMISNGNKMNTNVNNKFISRNTAVEINTSTLQELFSDLRNYLIQAHDVTSKLSSDFWTKQIFMHAGQGQDETEVDLSNEQVILSCLLTRTSRAIEVLEKRTVLQLHDIPPTPVHPQDFIQPNSNLHIPLLSSTDTTDVRGMIAYEHLPYYLTRPYVQMEGYLFKALFFATEGENPLLTGSTHPTMLHQTPSSVPETHSTKFNSHHQLQQQQPKIEAQNSIPNTGVYKIASTSSRYYVLKGAFLIEYESVNSHIPYKSRCIDLRGRTILADKTPVGYYGQGITIYSRGVESAILLQLFTPQQAEFERWLVALSAAIVLPKNSTNVPIVQKNPPTQPPTPSSTNSTPPQISKNSNASPFGFGPQGTIRTQPVTGNLSTHKK